MRPDDIVKTSREETKYQRNGVRCCFVRGTELRLNTGKRLRRMGVVKEESEERRAGKGGGARRRYT